MDLLKRHSPASLEYVLDSTKLKRDSALWAIENLTSKGFLKTERQHEAIPRLTEEGRRYLGQFPEEELLTALKRTNWSGTLGGLQSSVKGFGIAFMWAKKNGWVTLGNAGQVQCTDSGKEIASGKKEYHLKKALKMLSKQGPTPKQALEKDNEELASLKNRGLIEIEERGILKSVEITEKGRKADSGTKEEGAGMLTRDMIAKGAQEKEKFRKYDINAPVEDIYPARLHPLHEFLDVIRNIWLNMGFTEVSGPIIESAFWNFDALFSPQDHPTREMQDTFFLKNPSEISVDDIALMKRVKRMHINGWKDKWREEVAKQAILRTHTTNVSAHSINRFATADEKSYPLKFFSIGRTFRNESIDYKHLAEFYMVDGIIIGNNLTLSNLMHTLKQFYAQLGMTNLVFRPAYFPFVEPGLEIYYRDKKKNDSIELGGAGIIRKEITKAMGTNKTVLAWGPGLDRLMFNSLGIDSISELYRNDMGWLRRRKELKM